MFGESVGQPVVRLTKVEFIANITSNAGDKGTRSARKEFTMWV